MCFDGLFVGLMVENKKTKKRWLITEFISSYSSLNKKQPDVFTVRLSNGMGKNLTIQVDELRKKFLW